jgi:hypothetical protein
MLRGVFVMKHIGHVERSIIDETYDIGHVERSICVK